MGGYLRESTESISASSLSLLCQILDEILPFASPMMFVLFFDVNARDRSN
jgi:hypothetical protein